MITFVGDQKETTIRLFIHLFSSTNTNSCSIIGCSMQRSLFISSETVADDNRHFLRCFFFDFILKTSAWSCKQLAADQHTCGAEWYIKLKVLKSPMEWVSSNQNARSGLTARSTSYSETLTRTLKMTITGMKVFHASVKIFKRLR